MRCNRRSSLFVGMLPPQFVGLLLEFDSLRKQLVIPVPLNKIRASHKRSVLRGAAIVVPEIEVSEVNGMCEGWSRQASIFAQAIHDRLRSQNLRVRTLHHFFALAINA